MLKLYNIIVNHAQWLNVCVRGNNQSYAKLRYTYMWNNNTELVGNLFTFTCANSAFRFVEYDYSKYI